MPGNGPCACLSRKRADLVELQPFLDACKDLVAIQPPDRLRGPLGDAVQEECIAGVGPGIARDDLEVRQDAPGGPGSRGLGLIVVRDAQTPGARGLSRMYFKPSYRLKLERSSAPQRS